MQLYDKDLLSMQEVRELVGAAKKAQQELAEKTQAEVDRAVDRRRRRAQCTASGADGA